MSEEKKVTRKLRAILSADVKGYSILVANDEVGTIQTLKEYRDIMSACIEQHGGRVVDAVGDNLLAEFESAVDAVQCSVQVQKELMDKNQELSEDKRLKFRIGINIGDVIQDGNCIFGDGVNIAARIEGLADPGGICISRNAYDHIRNKLNLGFEYLGEHQVKNIKQPVRVYKVLMDSEDAGKLIGEKQKTSKYKWVLPVVIIAAIIVTSIFWYITQIIIRPGIWSVKISESGEFELTDIYGADKGKIWIEGDAVCFQYDTHFDGLKGCSDIYKNPEGDKKTLSEYLRLTDFWILPFSIEE